MKKGLLVTLGAISLVAHAARAEDNLITCTGTLIGVWVNPKLYLSVIYDAAANRTCTLNEEGAGHYQRACSVGGKCRIVGTYEMLGSDRLYDPTFSIQRIISIDSVAEDQRDKAPAPQASAARVENRSAWRTYPGGAITVIKPTDRGTIRPDEVPPEQHGPATETQKLTEAQPAPNANTQPNPPTLADNLRGWQYARWGMTPQEVRSASGGAAVPDASGGPSGLVAPYRANGIDFQAHFMFLNDLKPPKNFECSGLMRLLIDTYGPPQSSSGGVVPLAQWFDRAHGNIVTGSQIGNSCDITYRELSAPGTPGRL